LGVGVLWWVKFGGGGEGGKPEKRPSNVQKKGGKEKWDFGRGMKRWEFEAMVYGVP